MDSDRTAHALQKRARRNRMLATAALVLLAGGGYWWYLDQQGGERVEADAERTAERGRDAGAAARPEYAIGEALSANAPVPGADAGGGFREIEWDALVPKGWDPLAPLKGLDLAQMQDEDPRAQQALETAKRYWQEAPVEPSMDGARVRLPGFVVSLGGEGEAIREFLLVPYFGACIHVPPPPANQVVHVQAGAPLQGTRTMDPVWIEGVLQVERAQTPMGDSGYVMRAARVEPYVEKGR